MQSHILKNRLALLFAALFVCGLSSPSAIANSDVNMVVMSPQFSTVRSSELTWSDIQKDLFTTLEQQLIKVDGLSLLNRRNLKTAMTEIKLAKAGVTSAEDATAVGKMLMADWVLMSNVDTFEVSHSQRKMALDDKRVSHTTLQLTIDYRIIDVVSQKLVLSERYSKAFNTKPTVLKPNQAVGAHISVNLANKAITHASQTIAEYINVALFGGVKQPPAATTHKATNHAKPAAAHKPSTPVLSDDDW